MATETDLVNVALGHIGHPAITSIAGTDTVSETCARLYPICRDDVLRSAHWNCATFRKQLAESEVNNLGDEWLYSYQLPVDPYCLKARRLVGLPVTDGSRWHPQKQAFRVEGRVLLTDVANAILLYTGRQEVSLFDASLFNALAVYLSAFLATAVRQNYKLAQQQLTAWVVLRDQAGGNDEAEGEKDVYTSFDLITDR